MTSSTMTTSVALCPDKLGGRSCMCHGTFLGMKHTSGWIHPIEEIDHHAAQWNRGDIYISEKDVFPGVTLEEGDAVVFYLYVDGKGLGAENCVPVWHEQARAMKALLAMSILLHGKAPMMATNVDTSKRAVVSKNMGMNFSSFYASDSDDHEEADSDDTNDTLARPAPISLADILFKSKRGVVNKNTAMNLSPFYAGDSAHDEDTDSDGTSDTIAKRAPIILADTLLKSEPKGFPSVGSASHAVGRCKQCSFFPFTCTKGVACEFCHFEHERLPRRKARKGPRVRERERAHLARVEAANLGAPDIPPSQEPMKIIPFLMTPNPNKLFSRPRANTLPTTDEGSADGISNSSTLCSALPFEREPASSTPVAKKCSSV